MKIQDTRSSVISRPGIRQDRYQQQSQADGSKKSVRKTVYSTPEELAALPNLRTPIEMLAKVYVSQHQDIVEITKKGLLLLHASKAKSRA